MFKNYNKYRVLRTFLDNPTESFRLRELGRKVKLAPLSLSNYLRELENESLIRSYEKNKIKFYTAQRDSIRFARFQKISIQYELYESGVIDELWEKLHPEAIILYGSHAKGEAIESSDVDLFLACKQKNIDLEEYEKKLGKRIHLIFKIADKIPAELKNNLANGIVMMGYFKVE
jgi:predicted nucleotidyltransferase